MKKLSLLALVIFAALLFALSCERTAEEPTMVGVIAIESIPLDYGALVSVTTDKHYPEWAQLWFADSSGTINMVRINWMEKTMLGEVLTVQRCQMLEGE